jgi:hypothetical protein
MTRLCKFLLIPRADAVPMPRRPGAVVADACRSLLIPQAEAFRQERAGAPASARKGTRRAAAIVNRCRSLLTARSGRRGAAGALTPAPPPGEANVRRGRCRNFRQLPSRRSARSRDRAKTFLAARR